MKSFRKMDFYKLFEQICSKSTISTAYKSFPHLSILSIAKYTLKHCTEELQKLSTEAAKMAQWGKTKGVPSMRPSSWIPKPHVQLDAVAHVWNLSTYSSMRGRERRITSRNSRAI